MGDIWEKLIFKWPFVGNFPLGKCYCSYFSNFTRDRQWKWNMIIVTMKNHCHNENLDFILLLVVSHIKWKTPLTERPFGEVTELCISHSYETYQTCKLVSWNCLTIMTSVLSGQTRRTIVFEWGGWRPTRCLRWKLVDHPLGSRTRPWDGWQDIVWFTSRRINFLPAVFPDSTSETFNKVFAEQVRVVERGQA